MSQYQTALLGLTVLVAALVAVMTFAVIRFAAAAKNAKRHLRETGTETALLASALHDAVTKLKAQEREMNARAVASEQLSAQIVESLTAGLLVVDRSGTIEIFNPAGRRMLDITADPVGADQRDVLRHAPQLVAVIEECLTSSQVIPRRSVEVTGAQRPIHFGVTVSPLRGPTRSAAICLFSDLTT